MPERGDPLLESLPFPVAVLVHRARTSLARGSGVAAAWATRDALETLARMIGALLAARYLNRPAGTPPRDADQDERIIGRLSKPRGLSFGDWVLLAADAAKPFDDSKDHPFHRLSELARSRDGRSEVLKFLDEAVHWRNEVFGHGVFRHDDAWYRDQAGRWLPRLESGAVALGHALDGASVVMMRPEGGRVHWMGLSRPDCTLPAGPRDLSPPLRLVGDGDHELALDPIVSVRRSSLDRPVLLYFLARIGARARLLDPVEGHIWEGERSTVLGALGVIGQGQPSARSSFDLREDDLADEVERLAFEHRYFEPTTLRDALIDRIVRLPRGYLVVEGEAGLGTAPVNDFETA